MEHRTPLTPRTGWLPGALAALLALTSIVGFWATRRALDRDRSRGANLASLSATDTLSAALTTEAALLEAVAGHLTRGAAPTSEALAGVTATVAPDHRGVVAWATGDAGNVTIAAATPPDRLAVGLDLSSEPEWRTVLSLARDDGRARSGVARGPYGSNTILVAVPSYTTTPPPPTVTERRSDLQGYAVEIGDAGALGRPVLERLGRGLAARWSEGTTVFAAFGDPSGSPPASAVAMPVNVLGQTSSVTVWPRGSTSRVPWLILVLGLFLAVGAGVTAAISTRSTRRLAQDALVRAEELGFIAKTGPLLQQSLDLGDLLPSFVIELSDEFDLDGVAISLISDNGRVVRAFSFGAALMPLPKAPIDLARLPNAVATGGQVTIPLNRGGRTMGALVAQARGGLQPARLQALKAVSDLLAAALGNARLFQEEQEMVKRLRDLDRMKTTFLGSVSHELRTSVTAIAGFADLLANQLGGLTDDQQADFLQRINRNATSLGLLVDDLLDFARLERSAMAVMIQPVDLSDLVPKVIDQTASILQAHGVSTTVASGVVAMADPSAVERILVNLLSNAAKYSPEGTDVEIRLWPENAIAVLEVADHGPGIPSDQRERVFDLFYRVESTSTRAMRGVGIGLALVRQLVGLLEGTVSAEETPGGGATLRVELPLADDAAPELGTPAETAVPRR